MKPVLCFLGKVNEFSSNDICPMRHRIPAATLPYTCRKLSRKHCRIASLNRKNCKLSFLRRMICDMARKNRELQGFLLTFEVGMFYVHQ